MKVTINISTQREQEYVDGKYVLQNPLDKDRAAQNISFTFVGYESNASLAPLTAVVMEWFQDKMAASPQDEANAFLARRNSEIQQKLAKIEEGTKIIATTDKKSPKKPAN